MNPSEQIEITLDIERRFLTSLEQKNSWGKNEVKELYRTSKISAYEHFMQRSKSDKPELIKKLCPACKGGAEFDNGEQCTICGNTGVIFIKNK